MAPLFSFFFFFNQVTNNNNNNNTCKRASHSDKTIDSYESRMTYYDISLMDSFFISVNAETI